MQARLGPALAALLCFLRGRVSAGGHFPQRLAQRLFGSFGTLSGTGLFRSLCLRWRLGPFHEVEGRGAGFRAGEGLAEGLLVVGDPGGGQAGAGGGHVALFPRGHGERAGGL